MKPAAQSELSLQVQVAGHLDKYLAPPAIYTAFPAGGGGMQRGRILKASGLKSGFPDLMIMSGAALKPALLYRPGSGLFLLELKTLTGVLSEAQREMHAAIRAALPGVEIEVARTLEEAQRWFEFWNLPRRAQGRNSEAFARAVNGERGPEVKRSRARPFIDPLPDHLAS